MKRGLASVTIMELAGGSLLFPAICEQPDLCTQLLPPIQYVDAHIQAEKRTKQNNYDIHIYRMSQILTIFCRVITRAHPN